MGSADLQFPASISFVCPDARCHIGESCSECRENSLKQFLVMGVRHQQLVDQLSPLLKFYVSHPKAVNQANAGMFGRSCCCQNSSTIDDFCFVLWCLPSSCPMPAKAYAAAATFIYPEIGYCKFQFITVCWRSSVCTNKRSLQPMKSDLASDVCF